MIQDLKLESLTRNKQNKRHVRRFKDLQTPCVCMSMYSEASSRCWASRAPSLTTHHPQLHCWRWGPVGTVARLSPCSTPRGPWSVSSLSSAAASPALPAEEAQETEKLGSLKKKKKSLSFNPHSPSHVQTNPSKEMTQTVFYRIQAMNNK